jgi:hypothetical protein
MQVEINNHDSILLPLLGHVIFGTDEVCDVVLEKKPDTEAKKICSIIHDKAACILEVFNQEKVYINSLPIREMAILHPGDVVHIGNHKLKLVNENELPKVCSSPFKLVNQGADDQLITSVSGLRSFNRGSYGELTIVGSQNGYTHKCVHENDIPFSVSYINGELTLLCKKGEHLFINGNKAHYTVLKNGDFISTGFAKYGVESPGTSSFSKYSPSHPRNIQLSEEYLVKHEQEDNKTNSFVKNNLWWITLLLGLSSIAIILVLLKNL